MNPILKNELKLSVRTPKIAIIIMTVNGILAVFGIFSLVSLVGNSDAIDYTQMLKLYISLAYVEFAMMLLLIPTITSNSIAGERERQTLDILLTTKIKPWDIIFGKLASSLSSTLLLAVSTLPVLALVYIYGGLQLIDLFALISFLLVAAVFIGSIGVLFSAFVKKSTFAAIASYFFVISIILGSYIAVRGYYHLLWMHAASQPVYVDPNIGKVIYILLVNPLITFFGLINNQVGNSKAIESFCSVYGIYGNDFVVNHWLAISLLVQFILSFLFLWIASRKIDPLH